jgi:DNA-binding NtrC family response regulator
MAAIETPIVPAFDPVDIEGGYLPRLLQPRARILSVSSYSEDHLALRRIVDSTEWHLATASTCRGALRQMRRMTPAVVFCECSLPDGTWKEILAQTGNLAEPPPLIVTSRLADDYLWAEVLNFGGFDVLAKPLVAEEVRRVLASIWVHRQHPVRRTRVAGSAH